MDFIMSNTMNVDVAWDVCLFFLSHVKVAHKSKLAVMDRCMYVVCMYVCSMYVYVCKIFICLIKLVKSAAMMSLKQSLTAIIILDIVYWWLSASLAT